MMRLRGTHVLGWLGLGILAILPLVAIATQAVSTRWFFPDLIPREWTTGPLRRVAEDADTRRALTDSLTVGLVVTVAALALAVPAARALVLGRTRGAPFIAVALMVPTVLPPVALAMGLNVAFLRAGIAGSTGAVGAAHLVVALPYAVLLLAAALTRYDTAYEDQARVLGAGGTRIIVRVFLPLATPAILVTAALVFIVSWSQYLLTLLPGSGRVITLPVLLLAASNGGNPTATAVLALISAVPPAIAVVAVLRHLDRLGRPRGAGE